VTDAPPALIVEREGPILIATMNRPERMNALGGGMTEGLNDAWFQLRDDPTLKVMLLTGVGDRAFCVGADLRASTERFQQMGARTAQEVLDADRVPVIRPAFTANNFGLYKPVIAAINGWCLAGGCEIALGCDLRIMEAHAQMGLPEVKRGMAAKTTTHKIHFLTFLPLGLEIEWTGDPLTAERALQAGLVNEVVPSGRSLERAKELARVIAEAPASYLRYHKERLFQSIGLPFQYALSTRERSEGELRAELSKQTRVGQE
jgi:enoyl-CoA hydratase/carnithine racemase